MTVVDIERPPLREPNAPVGRRSGGRVATWRFAARLARREVRRRPGRTILVMLLVALPVAAMTIGSVMTRTQSVSYTERFHRTNGPADLVLCCAGTISTDDLAEVEASLPAGSRPVAFRHAFLPLRPEGTTISRRFVRVTDVPADDVLTAGLVHLQGGRMPAAGDEVLLSPPLAEHFGVSIGDEIRFEHVDRTLHVVGTGRLPTDLRADLMVAPGFPFEDLAPGYAGWRVHVDLPDGAVPSEVAATLDSGWSVEAADRDLDAAFQTESGRVLAWGWVAGVLALMVLGVIIAAAFATSARRQLVTLGQLSSNGADVGVLRRTLSLQGSWSGGLGALLGIGAGLVALVAFRPTVEWVLNSEVSDYRVSAVDLVIIALTGVGAATVAAFIPARTITKVPTLTALAGRRPPGRVPRRLVPLGLALFGGGLGLLMLVAVASRGDDGGSSGDLYAAVAVLGGVGVLLGACCVSPVVVSWLGPVGDRIGGSGRLAARSLARLRTRSAAVVTAIAAAGAIGVAGCTALASLSVDPVEGPAQMPLDAVAIVTSSYVVPPPPLDGRLGGLGKVVISERPVPVGSEIFDPPEPVFEPVSDDTRELLTTVVPGIELAPLRVATYDPAPVELIDRSAPPDESDFFEKSGMVDIADAALLDVIGLSGRDADALRERGVLVAAPFGKALGGTQRVVFRTEDGDVAVDAAVRRDDPRAWGPGRGSLLMTSEMADALGFDVVEAGVIGRGPRDLTDVQRNALGDALNSYFDDPFADVGERITQEYAIFEPPGSDVSQRVATLVVAGVALVFTLVVVAIGLSLSAAESREERDVLVAVGARPSSMRRVAGIKASLLVVAGAVLAIPTGFLPVALVIHTASRQELSNVAGNTVVRTQPIVVPWLMIGLLVVAIPIVAGVLAWAASAIAQRLRPTRMSTLSAD